jgi:hypothetical protein
VSAVVVDGYNTVVVPVKYQKDGQEGQQYRYQENKIPKRGKQQQEDWKMVQSAIGRWTKKSLNRNLENSFQQ